jgi:hypothetical protein
MAVAILGAFLYGCGDDESTEPVQPVEPTPVCRSSSGSREDLNTPASVVADWGQPLRLGAPVNTACPQDAIEISDDGMFLYVLYTEDILDSLNYEEIMAPHNNTYRLTRIGGPADFGEPQYYDLAQGIKYSLDGELSFSPDNSKIYFHSLRITNQGYQHDPIVNDYLDIYEADLTPDGMPGPARNLGPVVNSIYPDGEHAIHPDGVTMYFGSLRPDGFGETDMWKSSWDGQQWSEPINLGSTINSSANDYQPTFTADGDTMYFASGRNPLIGMAIYRSYRVADAWSAPQLVIRGLVGEPALTADGNLMYFVHVLSDASGNYDSDVWYCPRTGQ